MRIAIRTSLDKAKRILNMSKNQKDRLRGELSNFNFRVSEKQHAIGITPELLKRINNMTGEFIIYDKMSYKEAIKIAYHICMRCPRVYCEDFYLDVEKFR